MVLGKGWEGGRSWRSCRSEHTAAVTSYPAWGIRPLAAILPDAHAIIFFLRADT